MTAVKLRKRPIPYEMVWSQRGARRVSIQVSRAGQVIVRAPKGTARSFIQLMVDKHAAWIEEQVARIQAYLREFPPPRYLPGEQHRFKGKIYTLELVRVASAEDEGVCCSGSTLEVYSCNSRPAHVKALVEAWYLDEARDYLGRRLAALAEALPWVKSTPVLRVSRMKRQWGSCSYNGRISLNAWLMKTPRVCIDYVIVHELCHLKEHNHSPAFYRLLDSYMPNWRAAKEKLDAQWILEE